MSSTLKSIFRIIFYGLIFFVLEHFVESVEPFHNIRFTYGYPLMVFCSVIHGPAVGGFSIALGSFLTEIGKNSSDVLLTVDMLQTVDWFLIICSFINCASIGYVMRNVDIHNGFFEQKDIRLFNACQFGINLLCWWILYPVSTHLLMQKDLFTEMERGIWEALGYSISNLILATLFLALYARSRISKANFYRK